MLQNADMSCSVYVDLHLEFWIIHVVLLHENKQTAKTSLNKTKGKLKFWEDGNTIQKKWFLEFCIFIFICFPTFIELIQLIKTGKLKAQQTIQEVAHLWQKFTIHRDVKFSNFNG